MVLRACVEVGQFCVCTQCTWVCTSVCGSEGKEEEATVKFQRRACTRERSRDKGGLTVTNLQRKSNQHYSQSHQIGKDVYKSSFFLYLGTHSFFHQSVKNLISFTVYHSSLPFARWSVGTKRTMASCSVHQSHFSGVVSWTCHKLAQIARVRYLQGLPAVGGKPNAHFQSSHILSNKMQPVMH